VEQLMPNCKPYSEMTTAELRKATRQYDRQWSGPGLPGRPLTAADLGLHRKARGSREISSANLKRAEPIAARYQLLLWQDEDGEVSVWSADWPVGD
jgi:hypothetical protein